MKSISIFLIIIFCTQIVHGQNKLRIDESFLMKTSEISLGFVKSIVTDDQNIYVNDFFAGILKIDVSGALQKSYKKNGRGPGEFESISDLSVQNNRLYIIDDVLYRVSVFDKELKYLDSYDLPRLSSKSGFRLLPVKIWSINDRHIVQYEEVHTRTNLATDKEKRFVLFDNSFSVLNEKYIQLKADEMLVVSQGDEFLVSVLPFGRKSLADFTNYSKLWTWTGEPCFYIDGKKKCISFEPVTVADSTFKKLYNTEDGKLYRQTKLYKSYPFFENLLFFNDDKVLFSSRISESNVKLGIYSLTEGIVSEEFVLGHNFLPMSIEGEHVYGVNSPPFGYEEPKLFRYILGN